MKILINKKVVAKGKKWCKIAPLWHGRVNMAYMCIKYPRGVFIYNVPEVPDSRGLQFFPGV